jgi:nicotinamidase-related amidase
MFLKEKESRRHPSLLDPDRSLLLVIDAQEKFRPGMPTMEEAIRRAAILGKTAGRLGVPLVVSEQYPKALGSTVAEIASTFPAGTPVVPKMAFSAFDEPAWAEAVRESKRNQFVICGVETHVCIQQTAMDLLHNLEGQVYLVEDAISSRKASDKEAGLRRLESHGAQRVTVEMVLFEWLRKAGTPEFKEIQALVK